MPFYKVIYKYNCVCGLCLCVLMWQVDIFYTAHDVYSTLQCWYETHRAVRSSAQAEVLAKVRTLYFRCKQSWAAVWGERREEPLPCVTSDTHCVTSAFMWWIEKNKTSQDYYMAGTRDWFTEIRNSQEHWKYCIYLNQIKGSCRVYKVIIGHINKQKKVSCLYLSDIIMWRGRENPTSSFTNFSLCIHSDCIFTVHAIHIVKLLHCFKRLNNWCKYLSMREYIL